MGRQGTADRRRPAHLCRRRGAAGAARGGRVGRADHGHWRERGIRPGALAARPVHHGAAGSPGARRGRCGRLRGKRAVARAVPHPDGRGPGCAADRPVPARPDWRHQPGLEQLNDLLDAARDASGTGTRLIVSGPPATLDPGVELAAYRIVQEALTNARRHAPGAAVDVELHYTDDALRLRIRDNGPGPSPAPPADGHGLPGMRERAAAVGGQLRTGPAAGGGFLVDGWLPAKAEALG